jgi:tyrosine-protein kinase Etk/Wzc
MADQNEDIILIEYWNVLWRRKKMVISICSASVLLAMVISLLMPKYFRSETVLMPVGPDAGGLAAALSNMPLAGALTGAAGIQTPADKIMIVLKSRTIAEQVVRKFDLLKRFNEHDWEAGRNAWKDPEKPPLMQDAVKKVLDDVAVFKKSRDGAVTITIEWKDPVLAAEIANFYVFALTEFLKDKSINTTIQVVDRAIPAEKKFRPKISLNMALAGFTGLFVSLFLAFFLEYLNKQKIQKNA